ncbi:MAG TPA: MBL fold metallo-hydrolase [Spirochaetota bacterium]
MKRVKNIAVTACAVVVATMICSAGAEQSLVTIRNNGGYQTEITTPSGRRIFVDIGDPSGLSAVPSKGDILLETHCDPQDNWDGDFIESFPGRFLVVSEGEIAETDVRVIGIGSAQSEGLEIVGKGGSAYIYVVETGGLRIVFLGNCGQAKLSGEQCRKIGRVDILITQFNRPDSGMDIMNKKGFNLANQLSPSVIIPTLIDDAEIDYALKKWKGVRSAECLGLSPETLPRTPTFVMMGILGRFKGQPRKLPLSDFRNRTSAK